MPSLPADFVARGRADFTAAYRNFGGPSELVLLGDEEPRLSSFRFGQCRISKIASPAFSLASNRVRNCAGMEDQIVVTVDRTAESYFETGDFRSTADGATILIADRSADSVCGAGKASDRVIFSFPRALLPAMVRQALRGPLLVSGEGGMPTIFHDMACAAAEQQERLSEAERSRLQRSLVGLIGDMIATTVTEHDGEGPLGLATLRARAVAVIEAELFSLAGVEDLSARLGCSPRHLYNAFGERNTTPARYIWSLRLDRAREQIVSAGSEVSITEIAYGCGFQSYSHFSRAFKKQFGHAPQACWAARQPVAAGTSLAS